MREKIKNALLKTILVGATAITSLSFNPLTKDNTESGKIRKEVAYAYKYNKQGFNIWDYYNSEKMQSKNIERILEQVPKEQEKEENKPRLSLKEYRKYFARQIPLNVDNARSLSEALILNPRGTIGTLAKKRADFITNNKDIRAGFDETIKRLMPYLPAIKSIFTEAGVPEELLYLTIHESDFTNSRSVAGAVGMFQFMTETGQRNGLIINDGIDERLNPILAAKAAASELASLYGIFNDWCLATEAYNVGKDGVKRRLDSKNYSCNNFYASLGEELKEKSEQKLKIKRNGTLQEILLRNKIPKSRLEELAVYNELNNKEILKAGQILRIPDAEMETPENLKEIATYFPRLMATLIVLETDYPDILNMPASDEHFGIEEIKSKTADYFVNENDTLWKIASVYAQNCAERCAESFVRRIKIYNKLPNDKIRKGQRIEVPYTPKTLYEFAMMERMNFQELKLLNQHLNPNKELPDGTKIITYKTPRTEELRIGYKG
ncbi:MAG: lytic transglycosylase [Nanoarchaeota archaeon]